MSADHKADGGRQEDVRSTDASSIRSGREGEAL